MFAIDQTSELYAHMNANYVRMNELPDFDHYGQLLEAVERGDYFVSMGEVLLPKVEVSTASPDTIVVRADVQWTFPLAFGEIVWSDGNKTFTQTFPLTDTRPFGSQTFTWKPTRRIGSGPALRSGMSPGTAHSSIRLAGRPWILDQRKP
jgi:hypothetical protein